MTLPFPMLLKSTIKPSHNILDDHICNNILKLTNPHLSDWKECWSKDSVQPANSVQPAKNILCHTCRCIGIVAVWADDKVCHWWPKKPWHGLLLTLGVAREILAHCCRSVYYASLLSSPERHPPLENWLPAKQRTFWKAAAHLGVVRLERCSIVQGRYCLVGIALHGDWWACNAWLPGRKKLFGGRQRGVRCPPWARTARGGLRFTEGSRSGLIGRADWKLAKCLLVSCWIE